jgi:hypothetical protein
MKERKYSGPLSEKNEKTEKCNWVLRGRKGNKKE